MPLILNTGPRTDVSPYFTSYFVCRDTGSDKSDMIWTLGEIDITKESVLKSYQVSVSFFLMIKVNILRSSY